MTTIEYLITLILGVIGSLIASILLARINSANIRHYLFMGLSLFCLSLSISILIFVFLKKIDINIAVIGAAVLLNVATLVFQSMHIRKNNSRESNSINLLDFTSQAKKKCDEPLAETLGEIATAFNEIKRIFDKSYIRGISNSEYTAPIHFEKGLEYGKVTTRLETDIVDIYLKMIKRLHHHKGTLSTDIDYKMNAGTLNNGNCRWIADGLDGGLHFLRNIPIFTSSIALQVKEEEKWETIIGAVFIPVTNEFFFAVKGKGAYLNNWDTRLPLEDRTDKLNKCIFYIEDPNVITFKNKVTGRFNESFDFIKDAKKKISKTRNFNVGSFGLAYLAKGSWDAYLSLHGTTSMYDSEAGKLLVEESGRASERSNGIVIKEEIWGENGLDMGSRIVATSPKILENIKRDDNLIKYLKALFSKL